jgi:hypothetical protein
MATMPANTTMQTLYSRMRFDTRMTGAMVGIRLRGALGSTMTLVHNSMQNKPNTSALDEKIPRRATQLNRSGTRCTQGR